MNWDPHQTIRVLNRKTRAMYICYRLRSKVTCLKTFNRYSEFHASHEAIIRQLPRITNYNKIHWECKTITIRFAKNIKQCVKNIKQCVPNNGVYLGVFAWLKCLYLSDGGVQQELLRMSAARHQFASLIKCGHIRFTYYEILFP